MCINEKVQRPAGILAVAEWDSGADARRHIVTFVGGSRTTGGRAARPGAPLVGEGHGAVDGVVGCFDFIGQLVATRADSATAQPTVGLSALCCPPRRSWPHNFGSLPVRDQRRQ